MIASSTFLPQKVDAYKGHPYLFVSCIEAESLVYELDLGLMNLFPSNCSLLG